MVLWKACRHDIPHASECSQASSSCAHLTSRGRAFLNSDRSTRLSSLLWLQHCSSITSGSGMVLGIQTSKQTDADPESMSSKIEKSSKYCFRYTCKPDSLKTPPNLS